MMDVLGGLTAVTETLKITKELRSIDNKVLVAELKLRLADLVDGLMTAKEALQDAKQTEADLRLEIKDLKKTLHRKEHSEDENGCLYELDAEGQRISEPYCNLCFTKTERLFRLRRRDDNGGYEYHCDNCEKEYGIFHEYPQSSAYSDIDPFNV